MAYRDFSKNFAWALFCSVALLISIVLITVTSCKTKKGKKVSVVSHKTKFNVSDNQVRKVVLDNGMTILAYKDAAAPKVLVQIAYDVGSAVEESHERGLAHLVEHMIFKGTQKLAEGDIDAIARKFGAEFNAFTSNDVTSYYFQTNTVSWKHFVNILFDCMQNARFDEEHLASELKAVVQELNMYRDRHVSCMLEKAFALAFPSNHPYHYPIIGFKEELANLKASDVKHFYDKYYHPERVTLFLVGDIDLENDVNFAAEIFTALPKTQSAPRANFPPVIAQTQVNHAKMFQEIQMPYGCMYWAVPGRRAGGYAITEILVPIFGSGQNSRLYRKLVDELQIADSVDCQAEVLENAGLFFILFTPKAGKTQACYAAIEAELNELAKSGIGADELQRSVAGGVRAFLTSLESHSQLVSYWIDSFFATRDEFDLFKFTEKIEALTVKDLQEYFAANLNPFLASKIDLLPLPEEACDLWQESNEKIREQELEILRRHKRTAPVESPKFVKTLSDPEALDLKFPQPDADFTLPCGLRVLVRENRQLPLVCATFAFKDGEYFANTKEGYVADLMADMLFENSRGYTKEENLECLDALGADYNISEEHGYFVTASANFGQTLEHFFRILTQPDFQQEDLAKLKEITLNEIERQKDSPSSRAKKALSQELFAGTPYDWSFDDAIEFVQKISLADIRAKHLEVVTPEKMLVCISGDVVASEVQKLFEQCTKDWTFKPSLAQYQIPVPKTLSKLELQIPMRRDQAVLYMGRGSEVGFFHPDAIGLRLLNKIMFESLGSRVYQLREQTGLFYNASGGFAVGKKHGKGIDFVSAILNPENVALTKNLLAEVFARLATEGVTQEELDSAKQMSLQNILSFVSKNAEFSLALANLTILGAGFDYYAKTWEKIQATDVATINALAEKYCNLSGMAIIQAGATTTEK